MVTFNLARSKCCFPPAFNHFTCETISLLSFSLLSATAFARHLPASWLRRKRLRKSVGILLLTQAILRMIVEVRIRLLWMWMHFLCCALDPCRPFRTEPFARAINPQHHTDTVTASPPEGRRPVPRHAIAAHTVVPLSRLTTALLACFDSCIVVNITNSTFLTISSHGGHPIIG